MRDKVRQLRQLLSEAVPRRQAPSTAEMQAQRAFQLFDFNSGRALPVQQTHQARAIREITRITSWYQGLHGEIPRALDAARVNTLEGLDAGALDQLLARLRQLEDCIQNGGCAPDAPAAS